MEVLGEQRKRTAHRHGCQAPHGAQGAVSHDLAQVDEDLDVGVAVLTLADLVDELDPACGADAARGALATALGRTELHREAGLLGHVDGVVEGHDPAVADQAVAGGLTPCIRSGQRGGNRLLPRRRRPPDQTRQGAAFVKKRTLTRLHVAVGQNMGKARRQAEGLQDTRIGVRRQIIVGDRLARHARHFGGQFGIAVRPVPGQFIGLAVMAFPDRRHRNVTVGHSISTDLVNWQTVSDALTPSESPAFDSWTTWTGSVIRHGDLWYMFYTGTSREDAGERQSVGLATSPDLYTWTKEENLPVVAADSRWYKTLSAGYDYEPFRDPWVFKIPGENQWTMLTTASSIESKSRLDEAVMGVAKSNDLINWTVQPPLGKPGQGFGETEVFQFEIVDGIPIILFCCGPLWISDERKAAGEIGGVYSLPVAADLSDVDFNRSVLFPDTSVYASRLVKDSQGGWNLIAFINEIDGEFVGELSDPIPVTADPVRGLIPRG